MPAAEPRPAVLVTGHCGGLGRALVACFEGAGYVVLGLDARAEEADGPNASYRRFDLLEAAGSDEALERVSAGVRRRLAETDARLTCLVNNAAVQILGSLEELSLGDISRSFLVNAVAPMTLTKTFLDLLTESRGSVVNIGSIHASLTKPRFAAYAASKSALRGITQALSQDIGDAVRVNVVEPAAVDTEMLRDGFAGDEGALTELRNYHPSRRILLPEEVAELVLFLASDRCHGLNGAVIPVDGAIGNALHDPGR